MRYEPEDFMGTKGNPLDLRLRTMPEVMAEIANAKLEEWLRDAPTVYRSDGYNFPLWVYTVAVGDCVSEDVTHTAKLVAIEEINK